MSSMASARLFESVFSGIHFFHFSSFYFPSHFGQKARDSYHVTTHTRDICAAVAQTPSPGQPNHNSVKWAAITGGQFCVRSTFFFYPHQHQSRHIHFLWTLRRNLLLHVSRPQSLLPSRSGRKAPYITHRLAVYGPLVALAT